MGVWTKNQGNAEGFAGARPLPGRYFAIDTRVACATSAGATTGFQAMVDVSESGVITHRHPCSGVERVLAARDLTVSPLGHEPFTSQAPLMRYLGLHLDRQTSTPTLASTDMRSTRAWLTMNVDKVGYDIITRASGTTPQPLRSLSQLYITTTEAGRKVTRLAAEVSVRASSPDATTQIFEGSDFTLRLQKEANGCGGSLVAAVDGKPLTLDSLKGSCSLFTPPAPEITRPAVQLSTGSNFSCANFNGRAFCWGQNNTGQCGLGENNVTNVNAPVPVAGLSSGVGMVATGLRHGCAVKDSKTYCWGSNNAGELGQGNMGSAPQPVPLVVPSVFPASHVATGGSHSCAVVNKRGLCWGDNTYGQLGDGNVVMQSNVPVAVLLNQDIVSLHAGDRHTCALTSRGDAYCWGDNTDGQLGINSASSFPTPQKINGFHFVSLSARGINTCGIGSEGKLYCWGSDGGGQISADGTSGPAKISPFEVSAVPGPVTAVSVGQVFTCAIRNGQPLCWGDNMMGQLGNGTGGPVQAASPVVGLNQILDISAGFDHSLAYQLGAAKSWGSNGMGQLGDGTNDTRVIAGPFQLP